MRISFNLLLALLFITFSSCKKEQHKIDGWDLVWNDEFNGKNIDLSSWTFDLGTGAPSFREYGISSVSYTHLTLPTTPYV